MLEAWGEGEFEFGVLHEHSQSEYDQPRRVCPSPNQKGNLMLLHGARPADGTDRTTVEQALVVGLE